MTSNPRPRTARSDRRQDEYEPAPSHARALARLRQSIDGLDDQLLALLHARLDLVREVGSIKERLSNPSWVPWREKEVLQRLMAANRGRFPEDALRTMLTEIFSVSRRAERPLTVAYGGLPGSLAHAAATLQFGSTTHFTADESLEALFEQVSSGKADFGVVPPEVSCEGIVTHSLEYFLRSDLHICAECYLPLEITLAARASRRRIQRVAVQPQLYSFVREWLGSSVARDAPIILVPGSREAGEAASLNADTACIVPPFTARHFRLKMLVGGIPYGPSLRLRFLTAGRALPRPSAFDKTTIAFALTDRVGGLSDAITPLGRHGISISFLESYPPSRASPTVTFFADIRGHVEDARLKTAVDAMRRHCAYVKVLGSYPVFKDGSNP